MVRYDYGIRIAVCDDDKKFLENMVQLLNNIVQGLDTTITGYSDANKLLGDFRDKDIRYDVVFMDIEMGELNGIAVGKQLKDLDNEMLLILSTNYLEYAVKGYEAKAFRYLLKPIDENTLRGVMAEVEQERSRKQVLQIPVEGEELLVPLPQVLFLESREKYTTIYTENESYLTRLSLNDYEQQLQNKGFCRIHRKYLVNLGNISRWNAHLIEIGGHRLPVSRRNEKKFREQFYGYLEKGIQE